jgi:hypothetical protein
VVHVEVRDQIVSPTEIRGRMTISDPFGAYREIYDEVRTHAAVGFAPVE